MYKKWSSYLYGAFKDPAEMVEHAEKALKDVVYDTMIGTGLSGALVIPIIARVLGKSFAIVRKEGDSTHRELDIEGEIGARWIFVDDFVSSGKTRDRVKNAVEKASVGAKYGWNSFTTEYVGTYQYIRDGNVAFLAPNSSATGCSCCS